MINDDQSTLKRLPEEAEDLILKLLEKNQSLRLGALKEGVMGIKKHPWFAQMDFDKLEALKIEAPYVPTIKDPLDSSNFERYPEDDRVIPYNDNGKGYFDTF